ncbi:hypothetical protein, partial [Endozoicomonas sp. SESOKO4]|uniref:hypothetical protein n=1 Tax=Endozoicomonas sp. SESOKO4 TaxID=2828745 RepID=UPI00214864DA
GNVMSNSGAAKSECLIILPFHSDEQRGRIDQENNASYAVNRSLNRAFSPARVSTFQRFLQIALTSERRIFRIR